MWHSSRSHIITGPTNYRLNTVPLIMWSSLGYGPVQFASDQHLDIPFRSYRSLLFKFCTLCVFEPPLRVGTTYHVHLRFIRRCVTDFLLLIIELFSLDVTAEALQAKIDRKSAISLQHLTRSVWPKISRRRGRPQQLLLPQINKADIEVLWLLYRRPCMPREVSHILIGLSIIIL